MIDTRTGLKAIQEVAMNIRMIALSLFGLSMLSTGSMASSVEYNIAKGLAPIIQDQSISVLQPFKGDFRILGSKTYTDDEQAKFSPIDYAVSWGLFAEPEIARHISVNQYD